MVLYWKQHTHQLKNEQTKYSIQKRPNYDTCDNMDDSKLLHWAGRARPKRLSYHPCEVQEQVRPTCGDASTVTETGGGTDWKGYEGALWLTPPTVTSRGLHTSRNPQPLYPKPMHSTVCNLHTDFKKKAWMKAEESDTLWFELQLCHVTLSLIYQPYNEAHVVLVTCNISVNKADKMFCPWVHILVKGHSQ